ncbi:hypothetical protein ACTAQI_00355 [Pseudarthrobacter sp. alpha12b]
MHRYVSAFCPRCHETNPPLAQVRRLSGVLLVRADRVWLERGCPDHGLVRTLHDKSPETCASSIQAQNPRRFRQELRFAPAASHTIFSAANAKTFFKGLEQNSGLLPRQGLLGGNHEQWIPTRRRIATLWPPHGFNWRSPDGDVLRCSRGGG